MSKVQIATGEIIVRKDKKQRFIIVEDKYEFDDDTWSVIKSYMGLIDFDSIKTMGCLDFMHDKLEYCDFKSLYSTFIEKKIYYYINQIPMKNEEFWPWGSNGAEIFTTIIMDNIYDCRAFHLHKDITMYDYAREIYSFISLALIDFKNCRMTKPRKDHKYTRVAVGFQGVSKRYRDSFRIRRCPDTKRIEYKSKHTTSYLITEFIDRKYLLKKNENWLQKKYCK